jgi:hypothetical protein
LAGNAAISLGCAAVLGSALGRDVFPATADSGGEFEVLTGIHSTAGSPGPVSVRSQPASLAVEQLDPHLEPDLPHPWAVLFAHGLAMSAGLLTMSAGGLGLATLATRRLLGRRRRRATVSPGGSP